jgi:hypothetical protein
MQGTNRVRSECAQSDFTVWDSAEDFSRGEMAHRDYPDCGLEAVVFIGIGCVASALHVVHGSVGRR